jgi:hypothetical protein
LFHENKKGDLHMTRIAIIGTAGRRDDAARLSRDTFMAMVRVARAHIDELRANGHFSASDEPVVAVSGGAAWADHVAVSLFLSGHVDMLELHLPCPFDMANRRFQDDGTRDFRTNPGGTANYYHRQFSAKMGGNTLDGIRRAIDSGAIVKIGDGFHGRNKRVAQSQHMLAFTFGDGDVPKDGGTKHTWDSAPDWCQRVHVSLSSL